MCTYISTDIYTLSSSRKYSVRKAGSMPILKGGIVRERDEFYSGKSIVNALSVVCFILL